MRKGFSLLEIVVVLGIIVVLFAVIVVAVQPARRMQQARDAARSQDVRDILEAVSEYVAANDGLIPSGIDDVATSYQVLGTDASGCETTCTEYVTVAACIDLAPILVDQYLPAIPKDPKTGTDGNTDYALNRTTAGRIAVVACDPEIADSISAQR